MKKLFAMILSMLLLLACVMPTAAADGQVTYSRSAGKFIFAPGSDYSPTDLFPNFKDVMPGDTISQKILVKNDKNNNCKVRIYMRALGALEGSEAFLSQLKMTVKKDTNTVMFDAQANQKGGLAEWVELGTLYSGGECVLTVTLEVPVTLDNQFKNLVGYLDWEFAVEELAIEATDPKPPKTGDDSHIFLWTGVMLGSACLLLLLMGKKRKEQN